MKNIDINLTNLIIVYSLMIIPILIFIFFRLRLVKKTAISIARMTVQLALVGLYLKFIFNFNSLWLNIAWILIMIVVANFNVVSNTGLNKKKFITLWMMLKKHFELKRIHTTIMFSLFGMK